MINLSEIDKFAINLPWVDKRMRGRRLMINSLRFHGIPENLPWVERIMRGDGEG